MKRVAAPPASTLSPIPGLPAMVVAVPVAITLLRMVMRASVGHVQGLRAVLGYAYGVGEARIRPHVQLHYLRARSAAALLSQRPYRPNPRGLPVGGSRVRLALPRQYWRSGPPCGHAIGE